MENRRFRRTFWATTFALGSWSAAESLAQGPSPQASPQAYPVAIPSCKSCGHGLHDVRHRSGCTASADYYPSAVTRPSAQGQGQAGGPSPQGGAGMPGAMGAAGTGTGMAGTPFSETTPDAALPGAATPAGTIPGAAPAAAGADTGFAPGLGGGLDSTGGALNMLGDQGDIIIGPRGILGPDEVEGPAVSVQRAFALNLTDNNAAFLQNRIIPIEFNHFDRARRAYPGLIARPDRFNEAVGPSLQSATFVKTRDQRYTFGFEYIVAPRLSFLIRQSVVGIQQPELLLQRGTQLVQLGHFSYGWSDLQISPKYLLMQREKWQAVFSLGNVIPLGQNAPYHQFGNSFYVIQPTLLVFSQPTDRLIVQGALEYDIALTNSVNLSLLRYVVSAGYKVAGSPDSALKGLYPIVEFHTYNLFGDFTQTVVNTTVGVRANLFTRTQLGVAYAFPLTEQKQFQNEILASINIFF